MYKKNVIILVIMFFSFLLFSEKRDEMEENSIYKHHFINAAVFYPFSINKNVEDTANLNLTLLYGKIGQIAGLDLSAGISILDRGIQGIQLSGISGVSKGYLKGIQASGLMSVTGNRLEGIQLAGLLSVTGDNMKGIQAGGLASIAGDNGSGIQVSGIFAISGESFKGVQSSGIFSITGNNFTGIQAGGIFSITGNDFKGVQDSGLFSITGGNFKGVQLSGLFNIVGETLRGVQIGLLNFASESKGVQIGLVNSSKKNNGIPIGLVNLSKENGNIRMVTWSSNISAFNIGVKFEVNEIYTILHTGTVNLIDVSSSISSGFIYGVKIPCNKYSISIDLGYMNIDNKSFFRSFENNIDSHIIKLRLSAGLKISSKLSAFIGTGIANKFDHGKNMSDGEIIGMFFAGIELF